MTADSRKRAEIELDDRLIRLEEGLKALASLVEGRDARGDCRHLEAMGLAHVIRLHAEEAGRLASSSQDLELTKEGGR